MIFLQKKNLLNFLLSMRIKYNNHYYYKRESRVWFMQIKDWISKI